ncbi:hypothetical protein [Bacillus wiedmannii]|nr:hypothetical protein [Bacillus wiedmannii]
MGKCYIYKLNGDKPLSWSVVGTASKIASSSVKVEGIVVAVIKI